MPNHVADSKQQTRDNMQGVRPHREFQANDLIPPNFYYDQANARQMLHPPAGVHMTNGYIPIHNRPEVQPPAENGRQTHVCLIPRMLGSYMIQPSLRPAKLHLSMQRLGKNSNRGLHMLMPLFMN